MKKIISIFVCLYALFPVSLEAMLGRTARGAAQVARHARSGLREAGMGARATRDHVLNPGWKAGQRKGAFRDMAHGLLGGASRVSVAAVPEQAAVGNAFRGSSSLGPQIVLPGIGVVGCMTLLGSSDKTADGVGAEVEGDREAHVNAERLDLQEGKEAEKAVDVVSTEPMSGGSVLREIMRSVLSHAAFIVPEEGLSALQDSKEEPADEELALVIPSEQQDSTVAVPVEVADQDGKIEAYNVQLPQEFMQGFVRSMAMPMVGVLGTFLARGGRVRLPKHVFNQAVRGLQKLQSHRGQLLLQDASKVMKVHGKKVDHPRILRVLPQGSRAASAVAHASKVIKQQPVQRMVVAAPARGLAPRVTAMPTVPASRIVMPGKRVAEPGKPVRVAVRDVAAEAVPQLGSGVAKHVRSGRLAEGVRPGMVRGAVRTQIEGKPLPDVGAVMPRRLVKNLKTVSVKTLRPQSSEVVARQMRINNLKNHNQALRIQQAFRAWQENQTQKRAATTLQRIGRGMLGRRNARTKQAHIRAATRVQQAFRGHQARSRVVRLRQERVRQGAAVRIQALERRVQARKAYLDTLGKVRVAQRQVQRWRAQRLAKRQQQAAARLQGLARMRAARRQVVHMRRESAATRVQQAFRAQQARVRGAELRQVIRQARATTTLQRVGRGMLGRRAAQMKRAEQAQVSAATTVQRAVRAQQARVRVAAMRQERVRKDAAVRVQALVRRVQARQAYINKLDKIRKLQARIKGFMARRAFIRQQNSARRLQSVVRARAARRRVARIRQHQEQVRQRAVRVRQAAGRMQRVWRGSRVRAHMNRLKDNVRRLQRYTRGMFGRRVAQLRRQAVQNIQRVWRGMQGRRVVKKIDSAVRRLHRFARMVLRRVRRHIITPVLRWPRLALGLPIFGLGVLPQDRDEQHPEMVRGDTILPLPKIVAHKQHEKVEAQKDAQEEALASPSFIGVPDLARMATAQWCDRIKQKQDQAQKLAQAYAYQQKDKDGKHDVFGHDVTKTMRENKHLAQEDAPVGARMDKQGVTESYEHEPVVGVQGQLIQPVERVTSTYQPFRYTSVMAHTMLPQQQGTLPWYADALRFVMDGILMLWYVIRRMVKRRIEHIV